ncbi:MAG: FkbM family methyltransferase [Chitinophagaceae bacterium]
MKAFFYRMYFVYYKYFPIQKGKTFVGKLLYKCLGNAVFTIGKEKFLLHPLSLIDRMLIENEVYEEDIFVVIQDALKGSGGILLDIGANFGLFTIKAAKLPGVKVFSFEPSRRELLRLYTNVNLNGLTNVSIFPFGLADRDYTAELNICNDCNVGMNSLVNTFTDKKTEKIQCVALEHLLCNTFFEKNVRVIKMDVEGFEFNVLKGMSDLLDYYTGPIVLEVTYYLESEINIGYNPDDIYDFLEEKKFRPKYGKRYAVQYNDFFYKR